MDDRLSAYRWLVGQQGRRFCLGSDPIPTGKWLRERLGIHRNTMGRHISDARTNGRVQLNLMAASQLAFAAGIYPAISRSERAAETDVRSNRLELIHDYHLTGKCKSKMVGKLIRIVRSVENNLLSARKSYPRPHYWTSEGQLTKLGLEILARRELARDKSAAE